MGIILRLAILALGVVAYSKVMDTIFEPLEFKEVPEIDPEAYMKEVEEEVEGILNETRNKWEGV